MNLSVGIVGLPNAGKSTLFNALVARRLSPTAAHPFTTIEPHEAVVPVPDDKLTKLSLLLKPEKTTPATVTFIDIAGLVKGAHQDEGLGNQFLAKIREVDVIVHVVRVFEDVNVSHVHGIINPKEDIEVVNLELELGGIKNKPTIYVFNLSEQAFTKENSAQLNNQYTGILGISEGSFIVMCAKLEEELIDLTEDERKAYFKELGIAESGLEKLIREAYKLLELIIFYTIKGGKEVRGWSIKKGGTALEAAAKVHTDFAKNFIKAEVITVDELLVHGSWLKAKEQGKIRLEGKDYLVQDGDVIEFKIGT